MRRRGASAPAAGAPSSCWSSPPSPSSASSFISDAMGATPATRSLPGRAGFSRGRTPHRFELPKSIAEKRVCKGFVVAGAPEDALAKARACARLPFGGRSSTGAPGATGCRRRFPRAEAQAHDRDHALLLDVIEQVLPAIVVESGKYGGVGGVGRNHGRGATRRAGNNSAANDSESSPTKRRRRDFRGPRRRRCCLAGYRSATRQRPPGPGPEARRRFSGFGRCRRPRRMVFWP